MPRMIAAAERQRGRGQVQPVRAQVEDQLLAVLSRFRGNATPSAYFLVTARRAPSLRPPLDHTSDRPAGVDTLAAVDVDLARRARRRPSAEAVTSRADAAVHPRRRRLGQDPRAHPPHRLAGARAATSTPATSSPSRSPARRPASCAPGCGRSACATASPPARSTPSPTPAAGRAGPTAATAAADAARAQGRGARATRPAPASRPRCAPPTLGVRDRVGQGPAASPPTTTPPRRRRAGAHPAGRRRRGGRRLRALRGREAAPRRWSTSTTCSAGCADDLRRRPDVRRRPALAVPPPLRRRVPGRQPAAVPAARGVARRPRRPLRRRRPQPGHLRVERRRRRVPARLRSTTFPGAEVRAARRQLPLDPADPGRARRGPAPASRSPPRRPRAPTGPRARSPRWSASTTTPGEAAASPVRCVTTTGRGAPWSSQAVLVRTNAQTALIEQALRAGTHPLPRARRRGAARRARVYAICCAVGRSHGPFVTTLADLRGAGGVEQRPATPAAGRGRRERPRRTAPRPARQAAFDALRQARRGLPRRSTATPRARRSPLADAQRAVPTNPTAAATR